MAKEQEVKKRFESKFIKTKKTDCWIWTSAKKIDKNTTKTNDVYGVFWFKGRNRYAHRFAWEFYVGKIPKGKIVCHKCDTPLCVNPGHLFVGSLGDNIKDMVRKQRQLIGSRSAQKKLSEKQVLEIFKDKSSTIFLAKKYNVSMSAIGNIKCGYAWNYLTKLPRKRKTKYAHLALGE